MRVYIQQCLFGEPITCNARVAEYWFQFKGYDVVYFTQNGLRDGLIDDHLIGDSDNTILFGGVGTICEALLRAGRPAPPNIDIPDSISRYALRNTWPSTMGRVRSMVINNSHLLPLHVKPRDRHKLFNGTVMSRFRDLIPSSSVSDDEPVLIQDVVKFRSEWRATVLRDRIINVAHYVGDPLLFPDRRTMEAGLADFVDRPIGFSMDWGILDNDRTALVEVNDGFSLGNYGVRGCDYVALIEARWRQLMGLPDNGVGEQNLTE